MRRFKRGSIADRVERSLKPTIRQRVRGMFWMLVFRAGLKLGKFYGWQPADAKKIVRDKYARGEISLEDYIGLCFYIDRVW